jgi:anti-anti-sigma regulatory factor
MPFAIQSADDGISLALSGELTIRHARELARGVAASLVSGTAVTVQAGQLEHADTSILQLLVSLKKTSSAFSFEDVSPRFAAAIDRSGLRRELLQESDAMRTESRGK